MISTIGLLDGLTATGIILSSLIFGLLSFYHARKVGAKLLGIAGLYMIFIGSLWLGPCVDFLLLLFTGENIKPIYYYAWLSYSMVGPAVIVGFYIGSELIVPSKKKIIVGIYGLLGILFEIIIFTNVEGTFVFKEPFIGSGDTIDASFVQGSLGYLLVLVFQFSSLFFLFFGFLIKAKKSTGDIRRRFLYLALAILIFFICGILDSVVSAPFAIGFVRVVMMTFSLWMYLGLRK